MELEGEEGEVENVRDQEWERMREKVQILWNTYSCCGI